jgi:hypothetical protein
VRALLWLFAPGGHVGPKPTEIAGAHFCLHVLGEPVVLLFGDEPRDVQAKGFRQLDAAREIAQEAGVAQESLEHGRNANMPLIGRKAASELVKCLCVEVSQLIERRRSRHRPFKLCQSDDATGAQYALAFGKHLWPFAGPYNAIECPFIDQVEGRIGKSERLLDIHDLKAGIAVAT